MAARDAERSGQASTFLIPQRPYSYSVRGVNFSVEVKEGKELTWGDWGHVIHWLRTCDGLKDQWRAAKFIIFREAGVTVANGHLMALPPHLG